MKKQIRGISVLLIAVLLAAFSMPILVTAQGNPGAGCPSETKYYDTINGGMYFEQDGWMEFRSMTRTFDNVPEGIKFARVYTGVWAGSPGKGGDFNITVNGITSPTYPACDPCPQYDNCESWQCERCDTVNTSECHDYVTGCNVHFISYDATPYIVPGSNTVTVKTIGNQSCPKGKWDGRIYLIALLVVYEDASMPEMTYWINEGAPFMEDGSMCDGPDDHLNISFYFNGTHISNPARVKYWTFGFPHVANATTEPAYMKLNENDIGEYDYMEKYGGYEVLYRWDNIPPDYLNPSSNLFCYYEPSASYGGYGMYERVNVAVLMVLPDTMPPLVRDASASPAIIPEDTDNEPQWGENSTLNVTVRDNSNITSVTINLSTIGGSANQSMTNIEGNVWSVTTSASNGTASWNGSAYVPYQLQVNATDEHENSNTNVSINLTVMENGDVDEDGNVTDDDAMYIFRWWLHKPEFEEINEQVADVSGDGKVTAYDALYLFKWHLHKPGFGVLK